MDLRTSQLKQVILDAMGFTKIGSKKKIIDAVSEINSEIIKLSEMGGNLAVTPNVSNGNDADNSQHDLLEYFEIRRAIIEDVPQMRDIFNYYSKHYPEITREEHEKPESYFLESFHQQDERHPILVQVLTKPFYNHPVGTIISYIHIKAIRKDRSGYDSTAASSMYVHPEFKSKRLGSVLVILSAKFCLDNGIERVFNDVSASNTPSIKILEKMGFVKTAVLPGICTIKGKKIDMYVYFKDLLKDREQDAPIINKTMLVVRQNVVKA